MAKPCRTNTEQHVEASPAKSQLTGNYPPYLAKRVLILVFKRGKEMKNIIGWTILLLLSLIIEKWSHWSLSVALIGIIVIAAYRHTDQRSLITGDKYSKGIYWLAAFAFWPSLLFGK